MEEIVLRFLKMRCDETRPILVGLSGGPDSIALLYLLLKCAKMIPLKLGIAHIDHRWRQESEKEAETLKTLAESLHVPFHLKVLDPTSMHGNLEAACRDLRYQFFAEVAAIYDYQAVVLGHHQDDQAETILKRILEGASLVKLRGIAETKQQGGLAIWRPLLEVDKAKILSWLSKHDIPFFNDSTNLDPKFLRGKMRSRMMPYLAKEFGKEIKSALLYLGKESEELEHFFQTHLQPYFEKILRTPIGVWVDLSQKQPGTSFELKQLLRYVLSEEGISFSRSQMDVAVKCIREKRANCCIEAGDHEVQFDRGNIFIGKKLWADWKVAYEFVESDEKDLKLPTWRDVWQGHFFAIIPWSDDCKVDLPVTGTANWLDKWWTNHKVPAFMRWKIPVVWQNNRIVYEFLSGKMNTNHDKMRKWAKVTLEYSI
ncbi:MULTISPECIES: tRNA lysidine(34) synthetase TilS [Parachlamydia]|uniref:tRNA lysidine(34) synthetase TilS n=1 Tax=Parachlamydia TaxID=83551 RepID=UPI0001C177EA|nr:tRNA lysidine(34) synthetase TilS [Parachlamydia acanthamoebae]EFB40237.1 hypothetical protein pah_c221o029 [Parachlamydia acanthamoebae str. Hall's coccus]